MMSHWQPDDIGIRPLDMALFVEFKNLPGAPRGHSRTSVNRMNVLKDRIPLQLSQARTRTVGLRRCDGQTTTGSIHGMELA